MSIVKHVGTDDFVHTYQVYVTDLQKAIEIAEWGTYGKGGNEPLKYVRLINCSTDHLRAIRDQCQKFNKAYVILINEILKQRGTS